MAHSLRRYLSNRGSALFMVVSTMTALMIACMAMYFSVISARTTQFATFFQQQSYQSAISLNDMVLAGLMDGTLTSGDFDLLTTLSGMNEGDTITTGANGFSSFDSTQTGSDIAQMGAYSMDITRLPNEMVNGKDNMTFDIATTTINNGVADTVHTYVHIAMGDEEIPNGDNIFAATGYVPNDTYLDAGKYMTDVFFDTEFTYISLYDSACVFAGGLRAGGSLMINNSFNPMDSANNNIGGGAVITGRFQPVTWAVRNNFTVNYTGPIKFKAGSKILIGGDLNFPYGGGFDVDGAGTIDVYVLGNLTTPSSGIKTDKVNLYVDGYISEGQIGSPASVHVNGSYKSSTSCSHTKWNATDVQAIKRELNRETYSKTYKKWIVNGEDSSKDDYISGLDVAAGTAEKISIKLNPSNSTSNGIEAGTTTFTIAFPGAPSALNDTADAVCKAAGAKYPNAAGAVIKEVVGPTDWSGKQNFTGQYGDMTDGSKATVNTIVLDTGNNVKNIMYLRVCGYLADDGKTPSPSGKIFKWFPDSNTACTVLVKGKGTVVIDIPEGVIYQDCDRQQFLHETWFHLLGGEEYDVTGNVQLSDGSWGLKTSHVYNSLKIQKGSAGIAVNYIHSGCKKGDGCSYTKVYAKDKDGHNIECTKHPGEKKITVECSKHGTTSVSAFCPKCDEYSKEKVECLTGKNVDDGVSNSKTYTDGVCNNRLEKAEFVAATGSMPSDIFLVNSSESAEIRLSGYGIIQNGFYGIIYAPYMTFKAEGSSGDGANRLCGGLIVSDYAIDDHYAFTNLYPQTMPNDLMGDSSDVLAGLTEKSWKIGLGGY